MIFCAPESSGRGARYRFGQSSPQRAALLPCCVSKIILTPFLDRSCEGFIALEIPRGLKPRGSLGCYTECRLGADWAKTSPMTSSMGRSSMVTSSTR